MSEPRRRWRPTWVHWTIAVLLIVAATPVTLAVAWRQAGKAAFNGALAAQRSRGVETTLDEFIDSAAVVDADRQRRFHIWLDRVQASGMEPIALDDVQVDDWLRDGVPPAALGLWLGRWRALMHDGRLLLREGPITDGTLGYIAADFPPGRRQVPEIYSARMSMLMQVRPIAQWLALEAQGRNDSDAASDLDAFMTTLDRPGTILDAIIAMVVCDVRDEAYLRLIAAGWLSPSSAARWFEEPSPHLRWLADGWRGERLMWLVPSTLFDQREPWAAAEDNPLLNDEPIWRQRIRQYAFTQADAALLLDMYVAIEGRLRRDGTPWPDHASVRRRLHGPMADSIVNLIECCQTAAMYAANHRCARLAGRVLVHARAHGVPTDHAACVAAIGAEAFASDGDHLAMIYERLTPTRFRITIDPTAPMPDVVDAARFAGPHCHLGKSPRLLGSSGKMRLVDLQKCSAEVDVPPLNPDN